MKSSLIRGFVIGTASFVLGLTGLVDKLSGDVGRFRPPKTVVTSPRYNHGGLFVTDLGFFSGSNSHLIDGMTNSGKGPHEDYLKLSHIYEAGFTHYYETSPSPSEDDSSYSPMVRMAQQTMISQEGEGNEWGLGAFTSEMWSGDPNFPAGFYSKSVSHSFTEHVKSYYPGRDVLNVPLFGNIAHFYGNYGRFAIGDVSWIRGFGHPPDSNWLLHSGVSATPLTVPVYTQAALSVSLIGGSGYGDELITRGRMRTSGSATSSTRAIDLYWNSKTDGWLPYPPPSPVIEGNLESGLYDIESNPENRPLSFAELEEASNEILEQGLPSVKINNTGISDSVTDLTQPIPENVPTTFINSPSGLIEVIDAGTVIYTERVQLQRNQEKLNKIRSKSMNHHVSVGDGLEGMFETLGEDGAVFPEVLGWTRLNRDLAPGPGMPTREELHINPNDRGKNQYAPNVEFISGEYPSTFEYSAPFRGYTTINNRWGDVNVNNFGMVPMTVDIVGNKDPNHPINPNDYPVISSRQVYAYPTGIISREDGGSDLALTSQKMVFIGDDISLDAFHPTNYPSKSDPNTTIPGEGIHAFSISEGGDVHSVTIPRPSEIVVGPAYLSVMAENWLGDVNEPGFLIHLDLKPDGTINWKDMAIAEKNWGRSIEPLRIWSAWN